MYNSHAVQFTFNSHLKVYNSVVFSKFRMCNHHHILSLEHFHRSKKETLSTSLVVQWLRLCTSTAGGTGLIPGQGTKGFPVAQLVKNPPAMWETWVQSLGWEDPLEKGNTTHSSILDWRMPWIL